MIPKTNLSLALRPDLNFSKVSALGKPTVVIHGSASAFSLPIYSSDNEELYFSIKTPRRWDGTTDIKVNVYCYLTGAEDVGDKFNLQFSWNYNNCSGVLSGTPTDLTTETTVLTGRNAQYDVYCVEFTLDASGMTAGTILTGRLRRLDASGSEVTNEIAIFDWNIYFKRDKLGAKWS